MLAHSTDIELSLSQPFHYIIERSKYQSHTQASSSGTQITGRYFVFHFTLWRKWNHLQNVLWLLKKKRKET